MRADRPARTGRRRTGETGAREREEDGRTSTPRSERTHCDVHAEPFGLEPVWTRSSTESTSRSRRATASTACWTAASRSAAPCRCGEPAFRATTAILLDRMDVTCFKAEAEGPLFRTVNTGCVLAAETT